jgi:hypothetical protein
VFPVNDDDPEVTFLATRAANVIRAGVPADRIRDVIVVVPAPGPGVPSSAVRSALTRVTLADADAAIAATGGHHLDVLLAPFDRVEAAEAALEGSAWRRVSTGVFLAEPVSGGARARSTALEPSSPAAIALATLEALAALLAVGYGWARAALERPLQAAATAPAFGAAALAIVAIALERLGLPLTSHGVAGPVASGFAGGCGYLAWLVLERRARARPAPQVDQQPGK